MSVQPRDRASVDSARSTLLTLVAFGVFVVATAVMIGWILVSNANGT